MNDHEYVRRGLAHVDTLPLHVIRQTWQRIGHPVLRQNLSRIEVSPDAEGDRQRELAVAGGLARHIEHVLDAVDLLLKRCRYRFCNDVGRGAGVNGRDLNCGGYYVGYWAKGSDTSAPKPMSTMKRLTTVARIGRSMKI